MLAMTQILICFSLFGSYTKQNAFACIDFFTCKTQVTKMYVRPLLALFLSARTELISFMVQQSLGGDFTDLIVLFLAR